MNRLTKKRSGFTLIEILVVLIIVGVLASIALPNLFGNVARSKAYEALTSLSSYKTMLEACFDGNCGQEGTKCGTMVANFTPTTNFTYGWGFVPANTPCPPSGISAATIYIAGQGIATQGFIAVGTGDRVQLTRDANGIWTCAGYGKFLGVC